jgi:DNA-binding NtrC family response regulator
VRQRVIIIEDERDIVELVRYNFRKEGFEVESFSRGRICGAILPTSCSSTFCFPTKMGLKFASACAPTSG